MSEAPKPDRPEWSKDLALLGVVMGLVSSYSLGGIGLAYVGVHRGWWPEWSMVIGGVAGLGLSFYRIYRWVKLKRL